MWARTVGIGGRGLVPPARAQPLVERNGTAHFAPLVQGQRITGLIDRTPGHENRQVGAHAAAAEPGCAIERYLAVINRRGQRHLALTFAVQRGQRHLAQDERVKAGWLDADGNPVDPTFKTAQQGAATQVWAATSAQLEGLGGVYCEDCDIAVLDESEPPSFVGVRPHAVDAAQAERLWALSAELTGLDAFTASVFP